MLSYLLHLLQSLNVAYFAPLKRSYSNSILALARNYIYYISKETFLLAFKAAYKYILSKVAVLAPARHASVTSLGLALFCSLSSVAPIAS
jgi:hypothetical protein